MGQRLVGINLLVGAGNGTGREWSAGSERVSSSLYVSCHFRLMQSRIIYTTYLSLVYLVSWDYRDYRAGIFIPLVFYHSKRAYPVT
jgi:hypothetical protein